MPLAYKRVYNDISYFKKDHFCPECKAKLAKVQVSRVVNPKSPEAADFDFSGPCGSHPVGDVQFTYDEFECPECKKRLSVNEMKEIEGIPLPKKPSKLKKALFYAFWLLVFVAIGLIRYFS